MKEETKICKLCGKEYWPGEVRRIYGNLQPGYCSAGCFTEDFMKTIDIYPAASPVPEQNKIEDKGEGFTQGEWLLNKDKLIVYARIKDNGEPPLCTIHFDNGWNVPKEQAEANARLICNAPDMYNLLQDIIADDKIHGKLKGQQRITLKAILNRINNQK